MTVATVQSNSPHDIRRWRPEAEQAGCPQRWQSKRRFRRGVRLHFMGLFVGLAAVAATGVIRGGYGWWMLGRFAFAMFAFKVWESRILCSHCPYNAEKDSALHGIANYGSRKLWSYHPESTSRAELVRLWLGPVILSVFLFRSFFLHDSATLRLCVR